MSPEAQFATDLLVYATIAIDIAVLGLLLGLFFFRTQLFSFFAKLHFCGRCVATLVALCALGGSMLYSAVTGFQACALCLTSRTMMALLVVVLPLAMIRKFKEHTVLVVGIALSIIGMCVSLYQYVLQWLALTGTHLPCPAVSGLPSCDRIYFIEFGFITIPFVALSAFTLIFLLLFISRKMTPRKDSLTPQPS